MEPEVEVSEVLHRDALLARQSRDGEAAADDELRRCNQHINQCERRSVTGG